MADAANTALAKDPAQRHVNMRAFVRAGKASNAVAPPIEPVTRVMAEAERPKGGHGTARRDTPTKRSRNSRNSTAQRSCGSVGARRDEPSSGEGESPVGACQAREIARTRSRA